MVKFPGNNLAKMPIFSHHAHVAPTTIWILRKFCIFSHVLARISALKTQIFKLFVPKTPIFFFFLKENLLPRPYI